MRMLQTYAPALFCNPLSSYDVIAFILMRFRLFRPSTLIRYVCVFVSIHLHFERLQIDAFSMKTISVWVWTKGPNASKCMRFKTKTCGRALVTRRERHISYKLNLSSGRNFCFLICTFSNLKAFRAIKIRLILDFFHPFQMCLPVNYLRDNGMNNPNPIQTGPFQTLKGGEGGFWRPLTKRLHNLQIFCFLVILLYTDQIPFLYYIELYGF